MMTESHESRENQTRCIPDPQDADSLLRPCFTDAADEARSLQNIALWKSYLPADCVETMIAMGWDLSV
jgi:hypothetical protein